MRRVHLVQLALAGVLTAGVLPSRALAQDPDASEAAPAATGKTGDAGAAPGVTEPAPRDEAPPAKGTTPAAPRPKFGDTTTSGYFRGGFGGSSQKGRMTCFGLAIPGGLFSKYRLGNECEVWAESKFTTVVYAGEEGAVAHLHFMPTVFLPTTYIGYSPTATISSPAQFTTSTGATVSFPNLYADIQGISWLRGGTAWAGTRYYKREFVYISDFFYWNPSGVGAGVEDVEVVNGIKVSLAAFAVDGEPAPPADNTSPPLPSQTDFGIRYDLQVRGLRPYESGEFQLGVQVIQDYSNHFDANGARVTHGGWGVTLQHVQKLLGGENKLAFQYGRGGGTGFGTLARFYYPDFSLYHNPNEIRIRVVDVLTIQPFTWLGSQLAFVYQHDDLGVMGQKTDWISGGGRAAAAVLQHVKLLAEVGYDQVKKNNGADPQALLKLTGAVALTTGPEFSRRPELRLFFTHAIWNESARGASVDSGRLYTATDLLRGSIFGVQGELWW